MKNKQRLIQIVITIFVISIIIIGIKQLFPKSKADETEVTLSGSNTGYGMVTVTYHSNYLHGTAENGEKAQEDIYKIITPIYLNSDGEYCISLGEFKFPEKQISSDGITVPSQDANAINTGFRGYTLEQVPSGLVDESTGFWIGKTIGSNGPDDIPETAMENTSNGVKRIFNDWEDGIYQQGDELVLNSKNLSGYNNIKYSSTYDANRNNGTGTMNDTRNNYTIDIYAQWVKANIVYVASESTEEKATALNTLFGVNNIKTSNIKTSLTDAIKYVNTLGNNYYENYIVVTDYNANSSMGYSIKNNTNTGGNGFTITSKYFETDTDGRLYFSGNVAEVVMYEDMRLRYIDLYSKVAGNMGVNEIYTQGNCFIMEYGIRTFQGSTATNATNHEVTNIVHNSSNSSDTRGFINIDADGYTGFGTSRVAYTKVLSGHVFRCLIDRQSATMYKNKYTYYNIGGTAIVDMMLAGPAQGTLQFCTTYMNVKDEAKVACLYGGNQGHNSNNYWALDCITYLNIYGNASVSDGIYGGGGGRSKSVPFFSGEIYINVCGGKVKSIYGAGAASAIIQKSDGTDSNIYIDVKGGTVDTIYGGGNGMSYDMTSTLTTFSALNGSLTGNTSIKVSNATIGNIYGGGEGYDKENTAAGCAYRNGNATIIISSGAIITGNIYGGGKGFSSQPKATNLSSISKTVRWNIDGQEYTYTLDSELLQAISEIETADVINGKTIIVIEKNSIVKGDIFGGGEYAATTSSSGVEINISSGIVEGDVFGGGYSGMMGGDTNILVSAGTFNNIFGGGDQSYVKGNATVTIGDGTESIVTVNGLVYGGGRGYDSNNDGDASDYTTVYGKANVTIQGVNTKVENYGSMKLGAVAGEVNVLFKNHWTGNATAKYKTMNGIDRATTVTFENSYVLLENKDSEGNLEGIKSIENLVIPSGSGLKISADGEITGNFMGGGELYLDSAVCLTVGGDISEVTRLILNPELFTEENVNKIEGGVENPYLKVKGESQATDTEALAIELVSGERRYRILSQRYTEESGTVYSYYYIDETIIITDYVEIESTSVNDRVYNGQISNIEGISIANRGVFTNEMKLHYELLADESNVDKYENLSRHFTIKIDAQEIVKIPKGTEILMIFNNVYYTYIVEQDISEIPLSYFKDNSGQVFSGEFSSLRNVEGVQKDYNEITGSTTYRYDETYRFIVSFMNVENPITNGTYYSMINVNDAGEWIDEGQLEGANIVQIQNREYDYDYQLDRQEYESDGVVNISGKLNLTESTNTDENSQGLVAIIGLNNNQGNIVGIPEGTIISINDDNYEAYKGIAQTKIIEELLKEQIIQDLNIKVDMSRVLPQNRLKDGDYKLTLELVLSKNDVLDKNIQEILEVPITIENIDKSTYGLKAQILNLDEEMPEDKLQLIQKGNEEKRTINLQYVGNIEEANVRIKVLEKTSEFTYEETDNSGKITTKVNDILVNEITTLEAEQMILVNFPDNIKSGTYRVVFELNNKYGDSKTECLANFIVAE